MPLPALPTAAELPSQANWGWWQQHCPTPTWEAASREPKGSMDLGDFLKRIHRDSARSFSKLSTQACFKLKVPNPHKILLASQNSKGEIKDCGWEVVFPRVGKRDCSPVRGTSKSQGKHFKHLERRPCTAHLAVRRHPETAVAVSNLTEIQFLYAQQRGNPCLRASAIRLVLGTNNKHTIKNVTGLYFMFILFFSAKPLRI